MRMYGAMSADAKKSFRKLANLAKKKVKSFFIILEHMNTYIRYSDSIQFDKNVMKMAPILNKLHVTMIQQRAASEENVSPKPD